MDAMEVLELDTENRFARVQAGLVNARLTRCNWPLSNWAWMKTPSARLCNRIWPMVV